MNKLLMRFVAAISAWIFIVFTAIAGQVPGTSVSMMPPNGYTPAERFPGFMKDAISASIVVTEIPGPYAEVVSGFDNKDRLEAQGIKLLSKTPIKIDGHTGMLLKAEQPAYGKLFRKWMLVADRDGETTIIVATYPKTSEKEGELLRKSILSAKFVKAADPLGALAFSATPVQPFKFAKVIGQTMILTPGGEIPAKDESVPVMVLGMSLSKNLIIADRKAFSEDRIKKTPGIKSITVSSSSPVTIDSLPGYVTMASGEGEKNETPLTLYQVLLYDNSGYCIMQGIAPSKEDSSYLPVFENIARSFRIKKQQGK